MFASILLFPLADVLNEESILKWYNEAHLAKGKSIFLEHMKTFVEWLKNAEEGKCIYVCVFVCVRASAWMCASSHVYWASVKGVILFQNRSQRKRKQTKDL